MNIPLDMFVFSQALGWTVVHSIWQIAGIFLIFKLLGWGLGHRNLLRYHSCLLAMGAAAIWSAWTFAHLYSSLIKVAVDSPSPTFGRLSAFTPAPARLPSRSESALWTLEHWLDNHTMFLGWFWCFGVAALSLRLAGGYWLSQRLRQRSQPLADSNIATHGQTLAKAMGIERLVKFLDNSHISEPMTLGCWKPVVLFPVGMLLQLTPAQIEVLLLHELAHIRRYDYLVNLFQLALEVCFFYHPLFWLLSREARTRREYCCDDLVLHHIQNPLLYARTLTAIKRTSLHHQNAFVMSATGKNNFTTRIQRIIGIAPNKAQRSQPVFLLLLLAGLVAGAVWPTMSAARAKNESVPQITDIFSPSSVRDSVSPQYIRAKPAPAPKATVASKPLANSEPKIDTIIYMYLNGHLMDAIVTKQAFLNHPEIIAVYKTGEKEERIQVLSYEVTVLPNNSTDPFSFISNKGTMENEWFSSMVKTLAPESKIYIDNVEVKVPGEDKPVNLGGLIFKIKG